MLLKNEIIVLTKYRFIHFCSSLKIEIISVSRFERSVAVVAVTLKSTQQHFRLVK